MADFCRQCSIEELGDDFGDMRGLTTAADTAKGLYATWCLCEGCGMIQVDHEGNCVTDCDKHHASR